LKTVGDYGKRLQEVKKSEIVIGNVIKHILFIIREEYATITDEDAASIVGSSTNAGAGIVGIKKRAPKLTQSGMLGWGMADDDGIKMGLKDEVHNNLKTVILQSIDDWLEGIEDLWRAISEEAIHHIHANEVIMTIGKSRTVEHFLKKAASARKFQVYVAEASPGYSGREMAKALASGTQVVDTTLISDAAIFALMSRVNKVIIGTHAVMANGGLLAQAGTHLIAQAAKYYKVPVIVCCGLYKLSPRFPSNLDDLQELQSPSQVLKFENIVGSMESVTVENPTWDYIPPDLVDLYLTTSGGYNPTYLYRLLAELYHPKDQNLC